MSNSNVSSPLSLPRGLTRDALLKAAIAEKARRANQVARLPLLDFVPAISPRWERPEHLLPIVNVFERALTEPVRAVISVPPQFGKTEVIMHGLARHMARKPWLRNAYATYGAQLSRKNSRRLRDLAVSAGVRLREDAQAVSEWMTADGGGLLATGVRLPLTGNPVDGILVIDDPHKDREDAESLLSRERIWDWYSSTALTRVHPTGSIIVCHTRWNDDDFIGRLSKEVDEDGRLVWEIINLPAIREDGSPLWHQRPLKFLEQKRRSTSEYDWWSLYMGSPRPRGSSVFRGARFYDRLPVRYRIGKGVDLAYTAKTRADWSVCVVLLREDRPGDEPLFYVVDIRRMQVEAPDFIRELESVDVSWPGSWHWFCSTTEKGVAQVVSSGNVFIEPEVATADKFVRAQPVSAAWNDGRVLVPRNAPWLKAFVDEIGSFSGVGDRRDDQVDALASAFHIVSGGPGGAAIVSGTGSRWEGEERGFG